jgi:ABC-2 type transport system ATP-binding protein
LLNTDTYDFNKQMIEVNSLSKTFRVHEKAPGLRASVRALFKRKWKNVYALRDVSLNIDEGEIVGLVGANGAGKTTLTKLLSGVIYPTSGSAKVLGHTPWEREIAFRKQMALVMGQKNQLWWDLPAGDCFLLLKDVYEIPDAEFKSRLNETAELLEVDKLLKTQVRRLSLGERMKMELIAALLHNPRCLFLDEPTIGLDITAQRSVRRFLKEYQRLYRPVMLLTSHYMQDIAELCKRVLVIRKGEIIYDGPLAKLQSQYANTREVVACVDQIEQDIPSNISRYKIEILRETHEIKGHIPKDEVPEFVNALFSSYTVRDLAVHAEDISLVIEKVMRDGLLHT